MKINMIKINLSVRGGGRQASRRSRVAESGFQNMIIIPASRTSYVAIFALKGARTGHIRQMSSLV